MHNNLMLKDKLREFVSENEYSTLEEAKEWSSTLNQS